MKWVIHLKKNPKTSNNIYYQWQNLSFQVKHERLCETHILHCEPVFSIQDIIIHGVTILCID